MNTKIRFASLALLLVIAMLSASCSSEEQAAGYNSASPAQAYEHWKQEQKASGQFLFLDVRTPGEYANGHIPGAKLLPVQELAGRMHEVPKNIPVYIYCVAGVRSSRASAMLAKAGYTNIINIPDGFPGWQSAGFPIGK